MRSLKVPLLAFVLGAIISAATVRYYWPRIAVKTEIKQQIVERNNIRTITKVVEKPTGEKETITEVIDNSTKTANSSQNHVQYKNSEWLLGASIGSKVLTIEPIYTLRIDRRIIGPIFAGAYGRTDGELGLSITMEF